MYGKNPYGYPGDQVPMGYPGMGQQMMGQPLMDQQEMMQKMGGPMWGGKMMGGQPMGGQSMGGKMMGGPMMGGKKMGGPMMMGRPVVIPSEESYVENILRLNRGKVATVYTTNENNPQWAARVFRGRVENAARDHVVLSDPESGTRYIILMVNIDFITFDEPLRYEPDIYGQ